MTLSVSEDSASTIVRNVYESFRMLGDALLVFEGVHTTDHVTPIKRLISLSVPTSRPLALIDSLRRLRHNLNYCGYQPSLEEV